VVVAALIGSATLRALYGFLTLYLAFAVKGHQLPADVLGFHLSDQLAIVVVGIPVFLLWRRSESA